MASHVTEPILRGLAALTVRNRVNAESRFEARRSDRPVVGQGR